MNQAKRIEILEILQKDNPNPKSELEYSNAFELLVAVVLSAQSTDKSVNKITRELWKEVKTPAELLALGQEKFEEKIRHIGLFRNKAKSVMGLCRALCEEHNQEVPATFEELVKLPGVGKKTASVVTNIAFGQPRIAVDTHVFRVANRTGYAKGKTPDEVQAKMERYTPMPWKVDAHHWFILLGRYTCKSRKPECWRCPIEKLCEYKEKNLELPAKRLLAKRQIDA